MQPTLQETVFNHSRYHRILQAISVFALFFCLSPASWAVTYYVSTSGKDTNSGTSLSYPFRTIQRAVDKAIAGDTINIRGGTYRESVSIYRGGGSAGRYVTIQAYGSEKPVVKGSVLVTGWTLHSGKIWKKTNWQHNSQQVFVDLRDGPSLKQIGMPSGHYSKYEYPKPLGSGVSSMVPGSFFYNNSQNVLYLWLPDGSNPNNHKIEVSTKRRVLFMGKPYIYVKGIKFRHSSSSAYIKQGMGVELSSHSVCDRCDIQYMDFAGLSMGYQQTGAQVINSIISNNGNSGINMPASFNFRVANNKISNNNTRNFYQFWHAGGIKAASKSYGRVEYNDVGHNNGSGVWFDYANSGNQIIIRNNFIHNNGPVEAAIFMEASKNALIYNNVITNNQRRGVYISASNSMKVYNNTIYGTRTHAAIEVNGMPRSGQTLTNNTVNNNIISHSTSKYDIFIARPNGGSIANNTSNFNLIYRASGSPQLAWGGNMYSSLSGWRTATGQDKNSQLGNPLFSAPSTSGSAANWSLKYSSPAVNKGKSLSIVNVDYNRKKRPNGTTHDVGAFEYGSSTTASNSTSGSGPLIAMSSPSYNGYKVRGNVSIAATAKGLIKRMAVYVDGALKYSVGKNSIAYTWNSSGARIGTHHIMVSAMDHENNWARVIRTVSVY